MCRHYRSCVSFTHNMCLKTGSLGLLLQVNGTLMLVC